MDEISKIEQRLSAALAKIEQATTVSDAQAGSQDEALDRLNAALADKDDQLASLTEQLEVLSSEKASGADTAQAAQDQVAQLTNQVETLRAQVTAGEESLREAETRRKNDLAELDEILDQLEPLFEGSN